MSDRKARLAALAARAGRDKNRDINPDAAAMTTEPAGQEQGQQEQEQKAIKFRNYAPLDESLEKTNVDMGAGSGPEPPTKKFRADHEEHHGHHQHAN